MPRAKTWFAAVPSGNAAALLRGQADFVTQFMGRLFDDLDAHQLGGATSLHFHRLRDEVRFRVIGPVGAIPPLEADINQRLRAAQTTGLVLSYRSEPEGNWETPDPTYGTDVAGVAPAFTQFMETVSRATIAFLKAGGTAVPDQVLWNWLHLLHNPMTGIERHIVEVAPGSAVYRL
jgi:hypothetical protein